MLVEYSFYIAILSLAHLRVYDFEIYIYIYIYMSSFVDLMKYYVNIHMRPIFNTKSLPIKEVVTTV